MEALRAELTPSLPDAAAISNAAVLLFGGIETTEGLILNAVRHVLIDAAVRDEVIADRALDWAGRRGVVAPGAGRSGGGSLRDSVTSSWRVDTSVPATWSSSHSPAPTVTRRSSRTRIASTCAARTCAGSWRSPAGPHVCLGMDLARLEATTALAAVLTRLPGVRLDDDAPPPTGLVFRKPARLPVRW